MTLSSTVRGNYYSSGSISFSSLRNNFREQNLDGTFNTDDEQISASELKRVTDVSNPNPIVPDAYENSSISTGDNLKLSQFRGSVKYYLLDQTDVNDNSGDNTSPGLNLTTVSGVSNWNNNLSKNIIKSIGIAGTVGSYYPNQPAISIDNDTSNVIINVSGEVYGGGGQYNVNSGLGGTAIYVNNSLQSYTKVNVISDGLIWAGGGAGGRGGIGGRGGTGGTGGSYPLSNRTPGTGGIGGDGGIGGNGRGYGQSISSGIGGEEGSDGTSGDTLFGSDVRGGSSDDIPFRYPQLGTGNAIRNFTAGIGATGGTGGTGGDGGDWGEDGDPGFEGNSGPRGESSSTALFLNIAASVSNISYSASSNAGHTNRFYIRGVLNIAASGEGNNFSGNLGAINAGIYGPVESYDVSIGNNPNGIYRTTNANMYADDNGASGDDANDLMVFLGGGSNVQLVYLDFLGEFGEEGEDGEEGKLKGYAVGGANVTLSSTNVDTSTVKGRYVSLTDS
jgi:hypothetical protein